MPSLPYHHYWGHQLLEYGWEQVPKLWKAKTSRKLSKNQRLLALLALYDVEVRNGGHHQYFFNYAGDFFDEFQRHLLRIGAKLPLRRLRRAKATIFGSRRPAHDTGKRRRQMAGARVRSPALDRLDAAYFGGGDDVLLRAVWQTVRRDRKLLEEVEPGIFDE